MTLPINSSPPSSRNSLPENEDANVKSPSKFKKVKRVWAEIKSFFRGCFCCGGGSSKIAEPINPDRVKEKTTAPDNTDRNVASLARETSVRVTPKPPKPTELTRSYEPQDLNAPGFKIETVHEMPLKAVDMMPVVSDAEVEPIDLVTPIYFKNFPAFHVSMVHAEMVGCDAEVIVNAANNVLQRGHGIDGAIWAAGGAAYGKSHTKYSVHYNAKFTSGFAVVIKDVELKSPQYDEANRPIPGKFNETQKDVILVAGPSGKATKENDDALYSCVRNSLQLAHNQGKTSIAFPSISIGIFRYPKDHAARATMLAIEDFMKANEKSQLKTITIHNWSPHTLNLDAPKAKKAYEENLKYYKAFTEEYPSSFDIK